jgi:hypothetical protein
VRSSPGGGQLAIAAWSHIEDNAFYAALHAALSGDLADWLLAPFGWPDAQVLKDTVEAAGFHEVRVRSAALPLIFEGGNRSGRQSPRSNSARPIPRYIARRNTPQIKRRSRRTPCSTSWGRKVSANMNSNIAIARGVRKWHLADIPMR